MSSMERVPAIPFALESAAREGKLVPWIGAGFSTPYGFPTMPGLLGDLIDELERSLLGDLKLRRSRLPKNEQDLATLFRECREDLTNGAVDYAEIAERVRKAVDGRQDHIFFSALRSVLVSLDEKSKSSTLGHYLLKLLAPNRAITTNYDRLLERHVVSHASPVTGFDHASVHYYVEYDRGSPAVFKIHGSLDRPETIPFMEEQFKELYGETTKTRSWIPDLIRSVYRDSTLLFIGTSMSNSEKYFPYLKKLFKDAKPDRRLSMQTQTAGTTRHFALLMDPEDASNKEKQERELDELGVEVLWYRPEDSLHSEVWEVLATLATGVRVDEKTRDLQGQEWSGAYLAAERREYLDHQLFHELNATTVTYVTPTLSNAIATEEFIDVDCRACLESSGVFGTLGPNVIDDIVAGMQARRDNLETRLKDGSLEVRALMTKRGFEASLAGPWDSKDIEALKRNLARYRAALVLARDTKLSIRIVDDLTKNEGFSETGFTPNSYALIVSPYASDGGVNLVMAFAAQASNASFDVQLIEANTSMVDNRLARAERIWNSAKSERKTREFMEKQLESYEGKV